MCEPSLSENIPSNPIAANGVPSPGINPTNGLVTTRAVVFKRAIPPTTAPVIQPASHEQSPHVWKTGLLMYASVISSDG